MVATGGSVDGTVKIWDTSRVGGDLLVATMKGGGNNAILSCDVVNDLVAGGGTDKTCRIWNFKLQRMVHQLVGHGT
jgi:WD40 repeat protein